MAFPNFSATAEAIWSKEPGEEQQAQIGVKFLSLESADREALMKLLEGAAAVQSS